MKGKLRDLGEGYTIDRVLQEGHVDDGDGQIQIPVGEECDESFEDTEDISVSLDELDFSDVNLSADMFHFINTSPPVNLAIGEEGPGPSTAANRIQHAIQLDDDSDDRVTDIYAGAGRILRRTSLTSNSSDPDIESPYAPFSSELDWRIAKWAIKDSAGQAAFDRFLAIPGVSQIFIRHDLVLMHPQVVEKLGLSFHNVRALHKLIDEIPERAGKWKTTELKFPDQPEEKYTIRHRDPVEAIKSLWGDPAHVNDLVYVPKKIFSDSTRTNRIFSEMWTAHWWHALQVSV